MRMKSLFVFVIITLNVLCLDTVNAVHCRVFLLGGQSNMAGRADAAGLPTSPVNLQLPQDDVLFYYGTSLTTLRPGSGTDFGPEVTFGRTVADAFPAESFALMKYGVGGTSLSDNWDPTTGGTYSTFRSIVADGLAALTSAGHTYEIVGMLWTQGERDAKTGRTTAQYQADLIEFIDDIRTRYGTNLPFFISRLSINQTNISPSGLTNIRTAQDNVAALDPYAWLIDTDSMSLQGDNLHFDAAGQIALGQAFGQSYIDTATNGQAPFVDAGDDVVTWSGQPVQLDPNVINNDATELVYAWSADPADGVQFSNETIEAPTVTITITTANPSVIKLTLAVNNVGSSNPDVTDTMTVDVYDTACLATRLGLNEGVNHPTDVTGDCITDTEDLAEVALKWLTDHRLSEPEPRPAPNPAPTLPASILAYYSFDRDFTDASDNNNNLTVAEGTPTITDPTDGEYVYGGGALDADCTVNTQEYLNLSVPITFGGSDAWSVSFWGRRRPGTDNRTGMVLGDTSNTTDFIWIPDNPSQVQGLRFRNSNNVTSDFGGHPDDGAFHHWVVIADGAGSITAYRDNVFQGTLSASGAFSIASVGAAYSATTHTLDGQIDELYIFDEAIDAPTVDALYNNTLLGTSDPVDAGVDMVTWSGQSVQLDPNFAEGYTPTSFTWTAEPADGVAFDPDEFSESPQVTITKATANPSVALLTLTTDDGTGPQSDTLEIDVYDDACQAAKALGTVLDETDFNLDCITNLDDFAEVCQAWLEAY